MPISPKFSYTDIPSVDIHTIALPIRNKFTPTSKSTKKPSNIAITQPTFFIYPSLLIDELTFLFLNAFNYPVKTSVNTNIPHNMNIVFGSFGVLSPIPGIKICFLNGREELPS